MSLLLLNTKELLRKRNLAIGDWRCDAIKLRKAPIDQA